MKHPTRRRRANGIRSRSVDIYLTYRCNLRCNHCFLGENLSTNLTMEWRSFENLLSSCAIWQTEEVTFLGGEPFLYPRIDDAITLAQSRGFVARAVTNGTGSFRRFVDRFDGPQLPRIYFSIDGATPETHDAVRGAGVFERLIGSVKASRQRGYDQYGIVSLTHTNAHEVRDILTLCHDLELSHVNVHYVSEGGFATQDLVIELKEWRGLRADIERHASRLGLRVRLDNSLSPNGEYQGYCAIDNEASLMFYPDGRVFQCALFFDKPNAHSFFWDGEALWDCRGPGSESETASRQTGCVCPAAAALSSDSVAAAGELGCTIGCIYEKVDISGPVVELRA